MISRSKRLTGIVLASKQCGLAVAVIGVLAVLLTPQQAEAWQNVLKDPGFEEYKLDPRGFYLPTPDAPWQEITLGRGSTQLDINDWRAPEEMIEERPLGFTPGTTKYEGDGPEQNTGRILLEQHILGPDLATAAGKFYEAWVWLGGAGNDDDRGSDQKEEAGGWEISFFDNADPSTWRKTWKRSSPSRVRVSGAIPPSSRLRTKA